MSYPARDRVVEYKGRPTVEDGDIVTYVHLRPDGTYYEREFVFVVFEAGKRGRDTA